MGKAKKKQKKNRAGVKKLVAGFILLALLILILLPASVPRMMGYHVFDAVSGSMEPEIPVGSAVYVKYAKPSELEEKEIIAFYSNDTVIVHRVVENHQVEGFIDTRGDANLEEDEGSVPYDSVIGRVEYHLPFLGHFLILVSTTPGKLALAAIGIIGILLIVFAGSGKNKKHNEHS